MSNEKKIGAMETAAVRYAKARRTEIVRHWTNPYPPSTVFMAGSSGAGKSETAKWIIAKIPHILRIDPDDFREEFPPYNGKNASVFQKAVTFLAKAVYLEALGQGINVLFDGTFSVAGRLDEYIDMSLVKGRTVAIAYVYQDPVKAWGFVCARAEKEGRTVPMDRHVASYFGAYESVVAAKKKYGKEVILNASLRSGGGTTPDFYRDLSVSELDKLLGKMYDRDTLTKILQKGAKQ